MSNSNSTEVQSATSSKTVRESSGATNASKEVVLRVQRMSVKFDGLEDCIAGANVAPGAAGPLCESTLATQQLTDRLTQRSVSKVDLPHGTPEHMVTGFIIPPHPDD
jgi:hypothetical protein